MEGDKFSSGLKVLVIEDDPTNLIALEKLFTHYNCNHKVSIATKAATTLEMLRENKFDFIITDVSMLDMDKFKQNSGNGGGNVNLEETRLGKRKELDSGNVEDECRDEDEDSNPKKKARFVWTHALHEKFVSAVAQLGPENAFPKQILELMNVKGLTRYIVASHLQRYRLSQKKLNTKGATKPAKEDWKTSPSVVRSTHVKPHCIPTLDVYAALMENWNTQRRNKLPVSSCSGESQGWQLNSNVPDEAVGLRLDDNLIAYTDILVGYTTDTSFMQSTGFQDNVADALPILDDSWLSDLDQYFSN